MLNNLFIDTDVILDIVLDRVEFFENSSKIFRQFENGEVLLFTSPSIIINAQYTGQRLISKQKILLFWKQTYMLLKKPTDQNFQI